MPYILFTGMLVSLGGLIIATYKGTVLWRRIFKLVTSLFFVGTAMASSAQNLENKQYHSWIISGLVCSLFGDVLLAFPGMTYFLLGVTCFAGAHLCYIRGFSLLKKISKEDFVYLGILLIPLFSILLVGKFNFKGMLPLVIGYMLIISFMVIKAISLKSYYKHSERAVGLTIGGTLLFLISDTILLFKLFAINPFPYGDFFNSLTYYVGQDLLAISLAFPIATKQKTKA